MGVDPPGVGHVLDHNLTEVEVSFSKAQLQQFQIANLREGRGGEGRGGEGIKRPPEGHP